MLAALTALLAGMLLVLAPPARAGTDDGCVSSPEAGCLAGSVRGSDGPAGGVEIQVEGPESTETVTTGEDGTWSAAITANGTYTLTLDVGTLPEGQQLLSPDDNPRDLRAVVGATRQVNFELGDPEAVDEAPSGESGTGGTDPMVDAEGGEIIGEEAPRGGSTITPQRIAQQAAAGLRFGLVLALASVGLSLIYGTTGLSSFSHGEQVTLGALLTYVFASVLGWPLVPAIILAVALCASTGWLQDAGIWKPLRRRGVGLVQGMIVTIGLALALQYLFQLVFGGGTVSILNYIPGTWTIGPVRLNIPSYYAMGISVVALSAVGYFLLRTRTGRATRAVSDNPALAAASGIDVDRIIRLVWVVSAGLAGLAGVLLALIFNGANWTLGMQMLLLMFAAVTLGGLGTAFGALVGSLVIGMVVEMANLVVPTDLKYASALLILILVLLVRPQGILGRAERIG
ncbi:branched-chain amino acid ABC transporter permease [Actinotalea sp. K2]|uniref:branched-chain amino acid ABC transporter permease n=1 Tax=Actinotalea sp. K2 TaxID=2939438 RepID=UPI00201760D9|nr:branched-chain amino acid ABC transporter permease [Actinotalea sp. K2]MCL3861997.1 branched-chain amino acid ABC transporter permease [Actinotalea sp. K2]